MATRVRAGDGAGERSEAGEVATVMVSATGGKEYLYSRLHNQSSLLLCLRAREVQRLANRLNAGSRCLANRLGAGSRSLANRLGAGSRFMKPRRQTAILDAIQRQPVRSQEELRRRMRA